MERNSLAAYKIHVQASRPSINDPLYSSPPVTSYIKVHRAHPENRGRLSASLNQRVTSGITNGNAIKRMNINRKTIPSANAQTEV